jgi:adenosylmethionine-8-amino-7-oxononanoate aminotransferase
MLTSHQRSADVAPDRYGPLARRHLWMHYAGLGEEPEIFVRGDGCYVWDAGGGRHLDALSTLFCVNVGHGREELVEAAAEQMRELAFATTWGVAHPRAVELSARIAELAPEGLDRVFFTSGGAESVETALKMARAFHRLRGEGGRYKVIARELAWHGATLGALSATGLTEARAQFEPLLPGFLHVPTPNPYRDAADADPLWAADAIEDRILFEGPSTVAAVILEPVQNSGGCLVAPEGYWARVREICDRHGVLLISDDTICSWGRLGTWFGAGRYDYVPDLITTAKGLTSAYVPMGAVVAADRVVEPFLEERALFPHGLTFGGHPVAAAVALANIDVLASEDLLGHVRRTEGKLRETLASLYDIPLVGDVRGAGFFWGIELVRDQATKARFAPDEARALVARLSSALAEQRLICRAADRGYPVIQLAPPLIAGEEQFAEIGAALMKVLKHLARHSNI